MSPDFQARAARRRSCPPPPRAGRAGTAGPRAGCETCGPARTRRARTDRAWCRRGARPCSCRPRRWAARAPHWDSAEIAATSSARRFPGLSSRWKMELSTSCSFELRGPSTASKPPVTPVKVRPDSSFTTHTAISNPPASAMAMTDTSVDTRCWRRLFQTMSSSVMTRIRRRGGFVESGELLDPLEVREHLAVVTHEQQCRPVLGACSAQQRERLVRDAPHRDCRWAHPRAPASGCWRGRAPRRRAAADRPKAGAGSSRAGARARPVPATLSRNPGSGRRRRPSRAARSPGR